MDQQKRFYIAMAAYAFLALLVWFTMDGSAAPVGGGRISFRGVTLAVLVFFAIRTIWYRKDMGEKVGVGVVRPGSADQSHQP
jgi:hypothetical protein